MEDCTKGGFEVAFVSHQKPMIVFQVGFNILITVRSTGKVVSVPILPSKNKEIHVKTAIKLGFEEQRFYLHSTNGSSK